MARILVTPLSWGLGHATRDIPVIKELRSNGHDVTIAATGRAKALLWGEFPDCKFVEFEDYPAPYSGSKYFLPGFTAALPRIAAAISRERKEAKRIIAENKIDLVISDNRFAVCSPEIPTVFISHQLRFVLPGALKSLEPATQAFNALYHRDYARVVVPDNQPGHASLTGRLSEPVFEASRTKAYYSGILTSVSKIPLDGPAPDYFISISGPEPQRTILERLVMSQLPMLRGRKVVVLGRPEASSVRAFDADTTIFAHLPRAKMSAYMDAAKFIVTRSGYTTMMELAELDTRHALLIPTPGQTEQEYLSKYYEEKRWFHSVSQYKLNLVRDVEIARGYNGFPVMPKTPGNVRKLYAEVIAPLLGDVRKPAQPMLLTAGSR